MPGIGCFPQAGDRGMSEKEPRCHQCAHELNLISLMCTGCLEDVCTSGQFLTGDLDGLREELRRQIAARLLMIDALDKKQSRIEGGQRTAAAATAGGQLAHVADARPSSVSAVHRAFSLPPVSCGVGLAPSVSLTTSSATAIETANRCWLWSSKFVDRTGYNIRVSNGSMTAQKPITDDDKEWVRFSQIQTLQPMKPGSHFAVRVDTPCPCERNSMGIVVGVATNVIESDGITAIIGTGSSNYGFGYVCNNGACASVARELCVDRERDM
eukprot:TRINITY_DN300_c0_g1_i3.p1 TRINITY_DN300_c0_g1~~TRINITY_DN300_c0_g1_i3.p1  ORF type:complete len:269 (-),score=72.47 TRINITY_DN300_c0_g1_i3:2-808(-)